MDTHLDQHAEMMRAIRADADAVTIPTWDDIERAALNDVVLYRLVSEVRRGVPREPALMAAVLWLTKERQESMQRELERLKNTPAAGFRG